MDSMDKLRTRVEQLEQCIDYLEARIVYLETRESNRDRNELTIEVPEKVTPDLKKYDEKAQGYPEGQKGGI